MITKNQQRYFEGVGRRKESIARVRLIPQAKKGSMTVNDQPLTEYFSTNQLQSMAQAPLTAIDNSLPGQITVLVKGGGLAGQAAAVSLGLARALALANPDLKPELKKHKLLTRDARIKERRKFGLKKARKAPQWSKR